MLFKIDENLPVQIAESLCSLGHDAKTVNDEHLKGAKDPYLMRTCDLEKRILVTLDVDFADIRTYPPQEHRGIVLRLRDQSKPHVLRIFDSAVTLLKTEPVLGHLWIIEENMIRIRGEES
jgi:predicted nuclease of predicted toxin-antitoxin system